MEHHLSRCEHTLTLGGGYAWAEKSTSGEVISSLLWPPRIWSLGGRKQLCAYVFARACPCVCICACTRLHVRLHECVSCCVGLHVCALYVSCMYARTCMCLQVYVVHVACMRLVHVLAMCVSCVYVFACMCVCMCVCLICMCLHVHVLACMSCMYVCMCVCRRACLHVCGHYAFSCMCLLCLHA